MKVVPEECVYRHNKPIFVVSEHKSKVIFNNPARHEIEEIKIDGCVYTTAIGSRCDYMIHVGKRDITILVELKGSHVEDAMKQLKATHQELKNCFKSNVFWIISYSGNPQFTTKIQNFKKVALSQFNATFLVRKSGHSLNI